MEKAREQKEAIHDDRRGLGDAGRQGAGPGGSSQISLIGKANVTDDSATGVLMNPEYSERQTTDTTGPQREASCARQAELEPAKEPAVSTGSLAGRGRAQRKPGRNPEQRGPCEQVRRTASFERNQTEHLKVKNVIAEIKKMGKR